MPVRLFVNELSLPTEECDLFVAKERLGALVAVLRAVSDIDPAMRIDTAVPLSQISMGTNWTLAQIRNLPECKDASLYLRRMQDRSPFDQAIGEQDDQVAGGPEYRIPPSAAVRPGEIAVGLGLAHGMQGLSVSLATDAAWHAPLIDLERQSMDADGEISASIVSARNAADGDGVDHHAGPLRLILCPQVQNGAEIWDRRAEIFPNLHFIARTQRQLEQLLHGDPLVEVVLEMLIKLDRSIALWRETGSEKPPWSYFVRREPAGREELTRFSDEDGREHVFSLHADYAPGENRLHFLLTENPDRHCVVGHIGRKLGI